MYRQNHDSKIKIYRMFDYFDRVIKTKFDTFLYGENNILNFTAYVSNTYKAPYKLIRF